MNRFSPNVKALVVSAMAVVAVGIGVAVGSVVGGSGSDETPAPGTSISKAVDGSDRHLYRLSKQLGQESVAGSDRHLYRLSKQLGQESVAGSDRHLYQLAEENAAR